MTLPKRVAGCSLCEGTGGTLVWEGPQFRVVRADEPGFPAFWRLVWGEHVAEFSQLPAEGRTACMEAVAAIEAVVLRELAPAKVNIASLGNVVPHLHWHVIARFAWDSRFPAPVWAPATREADPALVEALAQQATRCDRSIAQAFGGDTLVKSAR